MGSRPSILQSGWSVIGTRASSQRPPGLLIAAGWVKTELGGPGAPQTVEQAVPGIIDTIDAHRAAGGPHFLNPQDQVIPWQIGDNDRLAHHRLCNFVIVVDGERAQGKVDVVVEMQAPATDNGATARFPSPGRAKR